MEEIEYVVDDRKEEMIKRTVVVCGVGGVAVKEPEGIVERSG